MMKLPNVTVSNTFLTRVYKRDDSYSVFYKDVCFHAGEYHVLTDWKEDDKKIEMISKHMKTFKFDPEKARLLVPDTHRIEKIDCDLVEKGAIFTIFEGRYLTREFRLAHENWEGMFKAHKDLFDKTCEGLKKSLNKDMNSPEMKKAEAKRERRRKRNSKK